MSDAALNIIRSFDAPRTRVWDAHSDATKLTQWWGPKGFVLEVVTLEFTPGGIFHYRMKNASMEMWGKFVYREITPESRMVFVSSFADAKGNVTRNPWSPTWPLETLNTLTLNEENGQTKLHLHAEPLTESAAERATFQGGHASMQQGFGNTYDQLGVFLAKQIDTQHKIA